MKILQELACSRRSRYGAASDPFASTRRSLSDPFAQAPKPKKIAAKKRVVKDESEDEFEFDDAPAAAPARAPRGGGRGKKAVNYAAIAGSDSEEDEWANESDSDGFVGDDSD